MASWIAFFRDYGYKVSTIDEVKNLDTPTVLDAHRCEETVRSCEEILALRRNMVATKTKDAGRRNLTIPIAVRRGSL
jgi:hypothetical protein